MTDTASRETPLADDARMNFKRVFDNMPFGVMAHFEWSDDPLKLKGRVVTLGDVFDNLQRLQTVLEIVARKAQNDALAKAELDRNLAGAGRLLGRLVAMAEGH